MIFGKKQSFFGRLSAKIGDAVMGRPAIDEEMYDELYERLACFVKSKVCIDHYRPCREAVYLHDFSSSVI